MTFYLKYRPKKIADIDLVEAREVLTKFLASSSFPHAVLLSGPKGIGKTSVARIIAKSLNCQEKVQMQTEPCGECPFCLEIDRGSFLDVLEIDAASNRGIDSIRQLKEGVSLAPVKGKIKIYIIDEVHMLTSEAFNALLKTLEEPPERVVFLLCTTNPEKIPQTILSRCLRINFRKASNKEIVQSLRRVVEREKLKIENSQVLEVIAQNVDGSFRDGQKLLEELSFGVNKITLEGVNKIIGRQAFLDPARLLTLLSKNELFLALEEVNRLEEEGVDWSFYLKNLLELLRRLLHGTWGLADGEKGEFLTDQLLAWVEAFSRAAREVKTSSLPVLAMELAISRMISQKTLVDSDSNLGKNKENRDQDQDKTTNPVLTKNLQQDKEKAESSAISEAKKIKKLKKNSPKLSISEEQWQMLLKKIKTKNHSLEAFLKAAYPISFEADRLTLGVYYKFHKECLEKEANRRIVEATAEEILSCQVSLFCRLEERPLRAIVKTKENENSQANLSEKSKDDYVYDAAKEIFGGDEQ